MQEELGEFKSVLQPGTSPQTLLQPPLTNGCDKNINYNTKNLNILYTYL